MTDAGDRGRLALIGAGRMGSAMLQGWLAGGADPGVDPGAASIDVVEPAPSAALLALGARIDLNPPPRIADQVVLAVKPQAFAALAPAIRDRVGPQTLVVSIMAGLPADLIHALVGGRVVRAMPNTPGAIGSGVTAYALGPGAGTADATRAERLLAPLGEVVGPLPEDQMDAVTAVSGSGPAYVFLLVEAMAEAGRALGLDAETAGRLARLTAAGAGAMLAQAGSDPRALREAVASPGGTTRAALDVLDAPEGLRALMAEAIGAAASRSRELGAGAGAGEPR